MGGTAIRIGGTLSTLLKSVEIQGTRKSQVPSSLHHFHSLFYSQLLEFICGCCKPMATSIISLCGPLPKHIFWNTWSVLAIAPCLLWAEQSRLFPSVSNTVPRGVV